MADSDDKAASLIEEAKECFQAAVEAEADNRDAGLDDLRFGRLGQQWPDEIAKQRRTDGRPMLTVNRMNTFIRQVVNDARQNKPSINTRPVDSKGDPETADVFNGIIRHIEASSSADIAYDTAIEAAVGIGFGYWRIGIDEAHDDTFDMDIMIHEVTDAFSIYGDPWATSKDGSDWLTAFVVERMPKSRFKRKYKGAEEAGWEADYEPAGDWVTADGILVAEYWTRTEVPRQIVELPDGSVVDTDQLKDPDFIAELMMLGNTPEPTARQRTVASYKVEQHILTGSEVLSSRVWPGRWIPIVPVYGDEVNEQGKRHFRSLIRDAKDPQRMLNFWRTAGTELVALAPKIPYIGEEGAFAGVDKEKWQNANQASYPTLSYPKGMQAPVRQQLDATASGAMQQAMQASDDIKSTTGMFDASLGAQSNETSGKAILARQREGDVSTFHFADNLTRSIRHSGRILIDLIPKVWNGERVVRLVGEDGAVSQQKINGPTPVMDKDGRPVMEPDPSQLPQPGQPPPMRPKMKTYSLTTGKYDLTAAAGPSYTTRREEAANQMMEFVRLFPAAAPVIGDLLASNLDWPGADEIAKRLKAMMPQGAGDVPPELQKLIEAGKAQIEELTAKLKAMEADHSIDAAKVAIDRKKVEVDAFKAETDRIKVTAEIRQAAMAPAAPAQA